MGFNLTKYSLNIFCDRVMLFVRNDSDSHGKTIYAHLFENYCAVEGDAVL